MAIHSNFVRLAMRWVTAAVVGCLSIVTTRPVAAQFFQPRSVGGVFIGADGLLKNVEQDERGELKREREKSLQPIPGDLKSISLRKISLRQLEAAIADAQKSGDALPDEIRYLAGLQRIQYVFVYPELSDIVLAGPGEGWRIDEQGEAVGIKSGRPVMLLDDLLVALRTAESSRQTGISCSIDPSADGLTKLQVLAKKLGAVGNDPSGAMAAIEQALGQQNITVTGIPASSHFARVIVAADYKMKRLAMGFDQAPVKGMPSFLELSKAGPKGMQNMLPRWWLAPNYDSLLADAEGLAWQIRGASVKAMTEEDYVGETGARQQTGKANPVAKKWADSMTAHYDELSAHDSCFGQLRNCIDLALVAALITKEHLTEKAGYSMPLLVSGDKLPADLYHSPQHVDSKASVLKKGSNWLISASGGVQIETWSLLEKTEATTALAPVREKSAGDGKRWWWN